ncbi:MAG: hypothetical protein FWD89_00410 [Firmicutes bacterium]|nr:hypothetical protein [Bacillota bacterium]MCL2770761.1 hypothetical protein [Bacillota bacterium]
MSKEIERVFLLAKNVDIKSIIVGAEKQVQTTAYLNEPGLKMRRVRVENGVYVYCEKVYDLDSPTTRDENERASCQEEFDELIMEGATYIHNARYFVKIGKGLVAEVDVFEDNLSGNGFVKIDVEFKAQKESDAFVPPSWFGKEITGTPSERHREAHLKGQK